MYQEWMCFPGKTHPKKFYDEVLVTLCARSLMIHIFAFDNPQLRLVSNWQEWLTVSAYLGLTVFVIWGVFAAQKR